MSKQQVENKIKNYKIKLVERALIHCEKERNFYEKYYFNHNSLKDHSCDFKHTCLAFIIVNLIGIVIAMAIVIILLLAKR